MLASFLTAFAVVLSPLIPSVFAHVAGMLIPFALGWYELKFCTEDSEDPAILRALQLPALSQLSARSLSLDQRGSAMGTEQIWLHKILFMRSSQVY